MSQTYEAIYEGGVIRLVDDIRLPDHTKVYVVVPEAVEKSNCHIRSPRLLHPHEAADFVKEVVEEGFNAL
jgi:predicted DNA-binding antitoxin AbrB/MazE fold protein